jgi:DNA helicase-2/ATP-dependent DNA helicase PcrA
MDISDLNQQQRAAVEHDSGPLLVVAGAGTGKTQVITRRIAYLILERGVPASQILALTFTDKAANEMQERVDSLLPYGVVDTNIMTFHSFGDQIVREYGLEIGLQPAATVMSAAQQLVFMRDNIDAFDLKYFAPISKPDSLLGELLTYFGRLKEEIISPDKYLAYAASLEGLDRDKHMELGQAYRVYCKLTRERGLMDFADQIALPLELLEKRPNIVQELRKRYRYILVDEFQDTNIAQNKLVQHIAGPSGNIMVVGDDDQSIYKFRGAAISNILDFSKTYKDAAQIVLTENYRSTQQVLDAAYQLIQHNNPDRLEVRNAINKQLHGQSGGPEPVLLTAATSDDEYEQVAIEIAKAIKNGESAGDIAVLIRKRNQAAHIIRALKNEGIDYYYAGNESLYDRPEVAVLRDFLQVVTDPTDSVALHHLLTSEAFEVPVELIIKLGAQAKRTNITLEEALRQESELPEVLDQIAEWRKASRDLSVGKLLFRFAEDTGYLDRLVEAARDNPLLEQRVRNVASFFTSISEYEKVATDTSALAYQVLEETLRQAGDTTVATEMDASPDQVQILTTHAAKGLEFERVFIVDLVAGTFPSINRRQGLSIPAALLSEDLPDEGAAHIQEERRLMYVALTRAKKHLTLSWAADHGGKRAKKPSPFIAEALGAQPEIHVETGVQGVLQFTKNFASTPAKQIQHTARFMQGDWLALTPHQIDDYLMCPLNFYYIHVLEVPQPPQPSLMYGTLMHGLIHSYYLQRQNGEVNRQALHDAIDTQWRSEGFVSKGQEQRRKQQAHATLDAFIDRQQDQTSIPTRMEMPFEFELPDMKLKVRGRMDAVIEGDTGVEIRDYKTSEVDDQKKADKKAKDSLQLATYTLAWKSMMGELPSQTTLDYIETGIRGAHTPTDSSIESLLIKIQQVADGIRSGDFAPSGNHFYCVHRKIQEDDHA